jgi:DNA-binding FadR family transcriptional regulator
MKEPMNLLLRAGALRVEHIHEVRVVLEVRIAEVAAENASNDDIERMQETIQRMTKGNISPIEYAEADVAFHNCLAAATQNPLFLALLNSIGDVMLEVRLCTPSSLGDTPRQRAVLYHTKILDSVRARNVEGARLAMVEHLAYAKELLPIVTQTPWEITLRRNQVEREKESCEAT